MKKLFAAPVFGAGLGFVVAVFAPAWIRALITAGHPALDLVFFPALGFVAGVVVLVVGLIAALVWELRPIRNGLKP